MIVFAQVHEAMVIATTNGIKPTGIFLGVVKSEAFEAAMIATGGAQEEGGTTYFCGLPVTYNSPTPGITVA